VLAREATPGGTAAALAASSSSLSLSSDSAEGGPDAETRLAARAGARMASLCATLLCSPTAAALALRREGALLTGAGGAPSALASRLLALRAAAPTADLTRLALAYPRLLVAPAADVARFSAALATLRAGLEGINVDLLAQEDPQLLLCDTSAGLDGLRALWSPDELCTLEADEAALALRAMSGLPRRGVAQATVTAASSGGGESGESGAAAAPVPQRGGGVQ
jgi:hypothetical protein